MLPVLTLEEGNPLWQNLLGLAVVACAVLIYWYQNLFLSNFQAGQSLIHPTCILPSVFAIAWYANTS
jgi:hypothetical protein